MTLLAGWAGFFGFWQPSPEPAPVPGSGSLESVPVEIWRVVLQGAPADTATRSEPSSPVVAGEHLLVGFSGVSELLLLNRSDGRRAGAFPAKGAVASAAVVEGNLVWFADSAGYTWCYRLDKPSAGPVWSHYSGAPVISSPTLAGGTLFLNNVNDTVYALDAATGELRWRYAHRLDASRGSALELFGAPSPTVTEDTVYAGFSDGFVVALGRADGTPSWNASVGEGTYPDLIAPAVLDGDALLVAGFNRPLLALDRATRAVRWRVEAGTASALAVDSGTAWLGGSDGILRSVDIRTGGVQWAWDSLTGGTLTEPQVTSQGVLVGSGEGTVYLVDTATGALRWRFTPGVLMTGVAARPTIAGADVYVLSNAGILYALRGDARPVVSRNRPDWVHPTSR